MIRPSLALADEYESYYFVADAHALTTLRDPELLKQLTVEITATWLALGLDPQKSTLYRQSDIPEVFELSWILSCVTAKGLLNRGHAYKSAVEANRAAGRLDDYDVNLGTYNYPMLMTADILLLDADVVPVGIDNRQHIEVARDVAQRANRLYGLTLKVPAGLISEDVGSIVGLDGRRMSKSYGNQIPIFAAPGDLRRLVMRITTDSKTPEEPKEPDTCNVFALYRHLAPPGEVEALRQRYVSGGIAYAEAKELLSSILESTLDEPRQRFLELLSAPHHLQEILSEAASRIRPRAQERLEIVREAFGVARRLKPPF